MNIKFIFIIFFTIVLIVSCGRPTSSTDSNQISFITNVDLNFDLDNLSPLTDFIKSEHHIVLETNDSCLINGIGRIEFMNDTIVLQSGQEVFSFDKNGKWITNFMNQGQGPEEYIQIDGLRVMSGLIYILDRNSKKIVVYTLNGSYVNSIRLEYEFIDFFLPDKDTIVLSSGYYNQSKYNFIWVDSRSGQILTKLAPYDLGQTVSFDNYIPFAGTYNNDLVVNTLFSHTNYILTIKSFNPFQKFRFNKSDQLPEFNSQNLDLGEILKFIKQSGYSGVNQLGYFTSSASYSYTSFTYRSGIKNSSVGFLANYILKVDKNGNVSGFICPNHCNSKDFPYFKSMRFMADGNLVSVISAEDLLEKDKSLNLDYWKSRGLTEDSNPVVFIYKLK